MSKKNKAAFFRVICDELDVVLRVKVLSISQESKIYEELRNNITKSPLPLSIADYKKGIVNLTVAEGVELEEGDYDAVYECIVQIYPALNLDILCADLNNQVIMEQGPDPFLKNLKATIKKQQQATTSGFDYSLSTNEDLIEIRGAIDKSIVGQEKAVESVMQTLKLLAAGLTKHSSMFFVGPTGVGKTELARVLGENYTGNFFKINCAEYSGQHEYAKLIGSPPGYVGHSEKSLLFEKAEKSNAWVFLFDEIEKAHHKLYDFLLSLLDDGTCTDNVGRILDFSKSIFIFTSNQGVGEVKRDTLGFDRTQTEVTDKEIKATVLKSVHRHFSPEFLNRIDETIFFSSLKEAEVKEIARMQLQQLPIRISEPVLKYVVKGGYSLEYGARNIKRFIKKNIAPKVADEILGNTIPKKGDLYKCSVSKGQLRIVDVEKVYTKEL
jgi:ATP-dependent Clp protease ATP-binding subunit ClpA